MTSTYELVGAPTLRALYDPSGIHTEVPDDLFYGTLAHLRSQAQLLGYDALHGCEIALADSIHMMVDTPSAVMEGVDSERAADIRRVIDIQTSKTVDRLAQITLRSSVDGSHFADTFPDGRVDRAALDIRVLAAIAHKGIRRRNGKEYLTHTEGTASVIEAAWWLHHDFDEESYQALRKLKMVAYAHDAPEDTVDPCDSSYLGRRTIASPFVIYKTLERHGLDEAERVAKATALLDNSKGLTGQKLANGMYIARMLVEGGQKEDLSSVVKMADLCDNSRLDAEDPEQPGVSERIAKYRRNENRILEHARQHYPSRIAAVVESIPHVTRNDRDRYYAKLRPLLIKPNEFNDSLLRTGLRLEPSELRFS